MLFSDKALTPKEPFDSDDPPTFSDGCVIWHAEPRFKETQYLRAPMKGRPHHRKAACNDQQA
jgi:hypothetical protein